VVLRVTHAAQRRELVQAHVPERVLAAGLVSAPGTGRTRARWAPASGLIDPHAGAADGRVSGDGSADADFPPRAWLAVTGTRIYAFSAERDDVGPLIGVWDRRDTSVRRTARLTSTRLSLSFGGSGAPTAVATRRWTGGNHQLVAFLLDPSRTT
jgi:hypothetical protein